LELAPCGKGDFMRYDRRSRQAKPKLFSSSFLAKTKLFYKSVLDGISS